MQRILMIEAQQVTRDKARLTYQAGQLYMAADIPEADDWVAQGIAEDPDAPKPEPIPEPAPDDSPEFATGGLVSAESLALLDAHDPGEVTLPSGKSLAGPDDPGASAGPADEGGGS